jgi:O-Antigen ligase
MPSWRSLRLPVTTGILALGLVTMFAWEDSLFVTTPITRVGRFVLAGAIIALVVELARLARTRDGRLGLRGLWRTAGGPDLWHNGPARLLTLAAAVMLVSVLISSHTTGCDCAGGSYGLIELVIWLAVAGIVVLAAPESRIPLLLAAGLGCVVAGILALAGAHGATTMSTTSQRLAGTYGNSNDFAVTQAIGLPIAVAAVLQSRTRWIRFAAMAAGLLLAVTLVLSYSRSGVLAAAGGVGATVVLFTPASRRLSVAAGLIVAGGLAAWLLYPVFVHDRDNADFGYELALNRETDASGWSRAETGLISKGPSQLSNAGPDILRVTTSTPDQGVSDKVGVAQPSATYDLHFQARVNPGGGPLFYGLEDNLLGAGPAAARSLSVGRWTTLRLTWHPSATATHARVYFWAGTPGSFELRHVVFGPRGAPAEVLPVRLAGYAVSSRQKIALANHRYIESRASAARIAVDAFEAHPLFGIGWERFDTYAATRSGVGPLASHDEYLRFAAELGIPGVLAIVLLCVAVMWAAWRARLDPLGPLLIGLVVTAGIALAFGNVLESPDIVLPFATAAAIAVAISAQRLTESARQ